MLFIPFFNSQKRTAALAVKDGYGLVLPFDDLTKETFTASINELTTNQNYKVQALRVSSLFRDVPMKPMDLAMYWIQYVIKTGGAKHLKARSVNFCWCKYMMTDVALVYLIIFVVSFLSWVLIIKLCIQRYRAKEHKGKFKYY